MKRLSCEMNKVASSLLQFLAPVLVLALICPASGYSLDQEHSLEFRGPPSSMFGYTVLLHHNRSHTWLVVGAPVDNSSSHASVQAPGSVYRCRISATFDPDGCKLMPSDVRTCGKTCEAESDHQWLGVSLSRQPTESGGHVLACAHRWKNVYYSKKDSQNNKLPYGVCYRYSSDLGQARPIIPCYVDHKRKFGEGYGSCQAGISNVLTEDLIIMGAPGTSYWTGSLLVYNTSSNSMSAYLDDDSRVVGFGSYLGYSVAAGHFLSPSSVEMVGGAPQYNQKGKVFIFSVDGSMLRVISDVTGVELGSYFGSSVCAVDVNADGLSDLLVGAPMATSATMEEGRVHVYINKGKAKLEEAEFHLTGRNSYAARFGEAIANIGDLDDDGYPEVAIGAPHEDELKGAVYIYNGMKEGISPTPSQRISGSTLGRKLMMFGQSLSSGIDIDGNGYQDVAVGAFLSDSAVILRSRPVIRLEVSLNLPPQIDQQVALCQEHKMAVVCFDVVVCFKVTSRQFKGVVELLYNLTSDVLHKTSFPHRFYFTMNGSSNITGVHSKIRHGHQSCTTHTVHQKKDVRDIFTPVKFEVSYSLKERRTITLHSKSFHPLKPILQQGRGMWNTISNQTSFARSCFLTDCSTNMQLSAQLVLPSEQKYFALGSGRTFVVNTTLVIAGDDAFLPRLMLRFPDNIHFIKVLQHEDNMVTCDVTKAVNSSTVYLDCGVSSLVLPTYSQVNLSFLFDVNQNSTPGDVVIQLNTSSENFEREEYLHDNSVSLTLPLKDEVNINIHGFVSPSSFVFGDDDLTPIDCYSENVNYTFKVINSGPSRSAKTVVDILLPKVLVPYPHRLLHILDWQSSQGVCSITDKTVPVNDDCDVPQASFIQQLVFFFSSSSSRRMFCGRGDHLCEHLVCHLGHLDAGRDATIQLEVRLNPAVLLQAPGRQSVMTMESLAVISSPRVNRDTIMIHEEPMAAVVVSAYFSKKPSTVVKVFIILVSLVLGLTILAALIWCLWKTGFFKRELQKKQEEFKRDSWDYVPKYDKSESTS
ncbi:integrin alpha-4 isoform X1 [Synchiropus splendidus]|uniref:integrin alpha-4 isoform X1 n=2 Tax=Synchiropus splendidus TaxID=270530 RepID=UPI00237DED95|nr:integrin alpha-4 isoform X1 [Synchiropus splendidus]